MAQLFKKWRSAKVQFMIHKGYKQNVNWTMAQKAVFVDFLVLKGTYLIFRSHQQVGNTILEIFCFCFVIIGGLILTQINFMFLL